MIKHAKVSPVAELRIFRVPQDFYILFKHVVLDRKRKGYNQNDMMIEALREWVARQKNHKSK